jgi:hypothetical protein
VRNRARSSTPLPRLTSVLYSKPPSSRNHCWSATAFSNRVGAFAVTSVASWWTIGLIPLGRSV